MHKTFQQSHIRNFSIIAHIDHGKSTLADRFLEMTGAVSQREFRAQYLDDMDLERERGITIKAHAVTTQFRTSKGETYLFNLIDTPGHVDFAYEVSRSLAACEGALLLIDATQGVEAQTIANAYLAIANNLVIIPVINKIDLSSADVEGVRTQIRDVLGLSEHEAFPVSAKDGRGVREVLEGLVDIIPAPTGSAEQPLKALIFDSWFDNYQGAIVLLRVMDGIIRQNMMIKMMSSGREFEVLEVGIFSPKRTKVPQLGPGEVGYICAGIKFEDLRDSLEKLQLNDTSFVYEPETSLALGFGFRCGFLGLLHMEIIRERLEREYALDLISTAPTVVYRVYSTTGDVIDIDNPSKLPDPSRIERIEEPFIKATIIVPEGYIGNILQLCQERRGIQVELSYLDPTRAMLTYELPLNEIVLDFYDRLKSRTQGYASLDYELLGYRKSDLEKLDLLLNGETVDALSIIAHKDKVISRGRQLAEKMKELIPKQMFEIAIQAAIGKRVIARETIGALKKNVTAKCYGGDISRKRKLWEKQKEGKKRMKQIGRVEVPQEAFLAILKTDPS
jgi:GTP-binding protein LepA